MTRDILVRDLLTHYPDLCKAMQATNHSSESSINPYHAENVFEHTLMVMTYLQTLGLPEPDKTTLLYVGLLHDIGKVNACKYNESKDRYSFHGHEGFSFFLAYDIIDKLSTILPVDKQLVLKLISLHGQHIEPSDFSHLLTIFRTADKFGAVRADELDLGEYEPLRFYPAKPASKTCTFLCGLPNTGKTTYVSQSSYDYVISRDTCIEELYIKKFKTKASYNTMYDIITNNYNSELKKYFNKSILKARNHLHIAIDMTMLSLRARRSMMYSLPGYSFYCKLFVASLSEIQSNQRIGKTIKEDVYTKMIRSFTYPQLAEGFTSIEVIDKDNTSLLNNSVFPDNSISTPVYLNSL